VDVGHRQRPDILWWLESGPRLEGTGHPDVRLLNLAAGEPAFNRHVEAGKRESRPDR